MASARDINQSLSPFTPSNPGDLMPSQPAEIKSKDWKNGENRSHCITPPVFSIQIEMKEDATKSDVSSANKSDTDSDFEVVNFFSGNPNVEIVRGRMRLYRTARTDGPRTAVVCVLSVPAYMSGADFCKFVAPFHSKIVHMQIIRDGSPNKVMVLLRMSNESTAEEFHHRYNGKPFTSLEPDMCHVLFVNTVETLSCAANCGPSLITMPFSVGASSSQSCSQSSSAPLVNTEDTQELPTCPVCLERLDASISGILTILCNHSFHSQCLSKWGDSSCPVCRYCQQPDDTSACMACGKTENLWICLICGHVGCGRYEGGHAYCHFKETSHTFSMELGTHRVWDYAGDNYVHRLIQNRADGKLVEVAADSTPIRWAYSRAQAGSNSASSAAGVIQTSRAIHTRRTNREDDSDGPVYEDWAAWNDAEEIMHLEEAMITSRIDAISAEYESLLTAQLDTQRQYYEQKIETMAEAHMLSESNAWAVERAKTQCEKEAQSLLKKYNKLKEETQFLKQVNEELVQNQTHWKERVETAERRVNDLEEQLRDIMFHLDTKNRIDSSGDGSPAAEDLASDLQNGSVSLHPKPGPSRSRKNNKKR
eukprot:TRINITY_DN1035_c0_g1::TRINITY_DN1035_c0_g1_i1::g.29970::m.29970 TRINITY_DN1035_c0_g1::TRINITY_DN1035_c0_g1_i1::g.29970  ORF type:complete len:593 (+),score=40.42,sp/Q7Z569/BRAP_HUMAN/37.21/2e-105,BRAP2/PF07576.7/4.7e-26,zf-UBP/PF02148.14/3.2e-20,zf-RING_2/PF13639.1/3.6e-09,zf-RING_2/PF13639.1/4.3e+03,zf-RING_5/PF14634.1/6e-06,zf-RING_5/PF14634.1/2e+03,zf-C3HC4_3/PF13920.1/0.0004,zf-C3HC4_3/PF13920.1/0.83,zf-C3HC4/PF00097.20/4.4e-05,zf-C3HC4_2/PF13923.1/4.8e-05,zf-C3HC4_2/PF13923.1/2.1e+02,zf-rbx